MHPPHDSSVRADQSVPSWTALQELGYTAREAQFLELAALHSGYFVRRQFNAFLGQSRGRAAADLIQKLFDREHITRDVFFRRTHVYHLSAKPLYTVLHQSDNRHRRRRSPFGIKTKLMALDYVVEHREQRFLATEEARVEYFTRRGIEHARLPQLVYRAARGGQSTARYFVEKFPLAVHSDGSIDLTYIDPGEYSVEGFETFLGRYTPLIVELPKVRLTYVADVTRNFAAATVRVEARWRTADDALGVPHQAENIGRMLRHFADRQLIDANQLTTISVARLREFRADRTRFDTPDCQALYRLWQEGARRPFGRGSCRQSLRTRVAHSTLRRSGSCTITARWESRHMRANWGPARTAGLRRAGPAHGPRGGPRRFAILGRMMRPRTGVAGARVGRPTHEGATPASGALDRHDAPRGRSLVCGAATTTGRPAWAPQHAKGSRRGRTAHRE